MKIFKHKLTGRLGILLVLFITSICYADRVCLEKSTGKLIEYQSGNAELGTLIKNAESSGHKKEDVEEKYVTAEEWAVIREEQIEKPAKEEATKKEKERKKKEDRIKQAMNLTDSDWRDLKEALRD